MSESSSIFVVTRHQPFDFGHGRKRVVGLSHGWSYGMTLSEAAAKLVTYCNNKTFRFMNSDLKQDFERSAVTLVNSVYAVNHVVGSMMMTRTMDRTCVADPRLDNNDHGSFVIDITDCWQGGGMAKYAFLQIVPLEDKRWVDVPVLRPLTAAQYLDVYYGPDRINDESDDPGRISYIRDECERIKQSFATAKLMTDDEVRSWFPKMFDGKSLKRRAAGIARMSKVGSAGKFSKKKTGSTRPPRELLV